MTQWEVPVSDIATGAHNRATQPPAEATKEVARTAQQEAAAVADEARQQAREVIAETKEQARSVINDAQAQLRVQADQQATKVAESMRRIAGELRALYEGRADQAASVRPYLHDAMARLDDAASRVESRGIEGVVGDVQRFARRRPGAFLAFAAGAGFVAGRMVRSTKDADDQYTPKHSAHYPASPYVPTREPDWQVR